MVGIATGWEGSRRREELPPNWPTLRAQVIERDHGLCQWRMSDGSICAEDGTDVDHIRDRDDHRLRNLQLLCSWHHDRKTAREANAAKPRFSPRRPREIHPGLL